MRICAVGDVAPCREDPAGIFASVADSLRAADLCFGQMECIVSDRGTPSPNARLAMRTSPAVAPVLRDAGFDVMSVAGNHAMDYGAQALADTLDNLTAAGIAWSGAGPTITQAREGAFVEAGGRKVALLSYSSILPEGYAAEGNRPGCAPLRAHTHYEMVEHDQPGTPPRVHTYALQSDLTAMTEAIRAAREEAQIVLVSVHWGIHFVRADIAEYQKEIAEAAIAAGADAILGHHPHLLKGIDFIEGKPVIYSMGNFAIDQPWAFSQNIWQDASLEHLQTLNAGWALEKKYMAPPETRHTLIAWLDFDTPEAPALALQPCRIDDDSIPRPLSPGMPEMDEWMDYVTAITAEAGLNAAYRLREDGFVDCFPA